MAHVLVVEDDAMNSLVFEKVLSRKCGYQTTITESAKEVLELAHNGQIDLILMDVSLSGTTHEGRRIDGLELCKILKEDSATNHIPVILATAHAMRGDRESFLKKSGADNYVSKPIVDHNSFCELIARTLGQKNPPEVGEKHAVNR